MFTYVDDEETTTEDGLWLERPPLGENGLWPQGLSLVATVPA